MIQQPLIFLDFDGCLNSISFLKTATPEQRRYNLDPQAIQNLNQLIEETNAKVVVTSTWRLYKTIDQLQQILNSVGFIGEIIDKTKNLLIGPYGHCILRGNEILEWMRDHPSELGVPYYDYTRYVIIDDDSDFLYNQRNNLIIVDGNVGITPKTAYIASRILNGQANFYQQPI